MTMTLSTGIRITRGDGNSHDYTAECGCLATVGSGGGTIVLCDEHNPATVVQALIKIGGLTPWDDVTAAINAARGVLAARVGEAL